MVSFKTIYFQKFHICIGYFGLFVNIKKRYRLVFTGDFLHTSSINMFIIKYPIKWPSCIIWGEWPSIWESDL